MRAMHDDPVMYIRSHLAHVLDQMLTAATTWAACHPDRGPELPIDLVVMAEYSAFLHERCLYELACERKGRKFRTQVLGASKALRTPVKERWYDHLNAAVLHVYRRGIEPDPVVDGDHLKDQVANLANDVVALFASLKANEPERSALQHALTTARDKADLVADSFDVQRIAWGTDDPFEGWGSHKWWPVGDA